MQMYFLLLVAVIAIISAVRVISAKNTVHSAFALILTFFATAILWLSLAAEFLAISLVLVYVGAVLVLFLFVVMMLEEEQVIVNSVKSKKYPILVSLILLVMMLSIFSIYQDKQVNSLAFDYASINNIKVLGYILFSKYILEFEVAGIILLVGIISAISLTHKAKANRKSQNISKQVSARASDRLRMLKLDGSEKLIEDK